MSRLPVSGTAPDDGASVSRDSLDVVIRRAIDLSLKEQETGEHVTEAELIKIAEELGLAPRHVRQALYERPAESAPQTFLDRHFGTTSVVALRAVPCEASIARGRLEDYLVAREYLQVRRRQGSNTYFEPADDAFSSIARAFSRPSGRFHIARTQRAYLTIRGLEPGWCHVRLEMNYPERRKSQVAGAITLGVLAGLPTGLIAGASISFGLGNTPMAITAGIVGGLASAGGIFAGSWALIRNEYRKWLGRSSDEADAMLDRLEQGDDLRPPASPWMQRLQQRLRGFGSRPASG